MRQFEIRIAQSDLERLKELLWEIPGVESAAFLLAGHHQVGDRTILLVRRVVEIPARDYRVRNGYRIELSTRAINGLASLCEANKLTAILAHSHPGDTPYSSSDDHGERRVSQVLQSFVPGGLIGSILMTPARTYGRVWLPNGESRPLSRLTSVGRAIRRVPIEGGQDEGFSLNNSEMHARQILAFGRDGQEAIGTTKVGIVGTSGTGSPLAEQLVRLGVQDLVLIDRDVFENSNRSRVYGSRYKDAYPSFWRRLFGWVTQPKVKIVANWLREINPEVQLKVIVGDVTEKSVAEQLLDRDIIFACTDDHWGRSILNQIAYQYLIPVVNLGIVITSARGKISHGMGVVQVLRPDHGCLWCSGYLSSDRIRAESLPESERKQLQGEGYLLGINEPAPSVVTLTTTVSGLAGTLFLQLVTDFMGRGGNISRLNYFVMEGVVRRGRVPQKDGCVCTKVRGKGDSKTLPVK